MPSKKISSRGPALVLGAASLLLSVPATGMQDAPPPPQSPPAANQQQTRQEELPAPYYESEDVSVLTRGPLHEAFATPWDGDPEPGPVIQQEPPQSIEEVPPARKPQGQNVDWIPGYWSWDDERKDFLWVSGVWREVPPNQQWVPGYWERADNGYRHISGFWTSGEQETIEYLPPPPESLENGPSSRAPDQAHFYVPGSWVYDVSATNHYVWRPGYWAPVQPHWVWVPDQYIWTPRGCVFVPGYWDYEIGSRGVVFAPVYFHQPVYTHQHYYYTPEIVIDADVNLLVHLFIGSDRHYYFGDWYGDRYAHGYTPWVNVHDTHVHYDPLFSYYSVAQSSGDVDVVSWVEQRYKYFVEHENVRPPHTLRDQVRFYQEARAQNIDDAVIRLSTFGNDIADIATGREPGFDFSQLGDDQWRDVIQRSQSWRSLVDERARLERGDRGDNRGDNRGQDRGQDRGDVPRDQTEGVRDDLRDARFRLRGWRERLNQQNQDSLNELDQRIKDLRERGNDRRQNPPQGTGEALEKAREEARDAFRQGDQQRNDALRQFRDMLRDRPARPNDWPAGRPPRGNSDLKLPDIPRLPDGAGRPGNRPGQENRGNRPPDNRDNKDKDKGDGNGKG